MEINELLPFPAEYLIYLILVIALVKTFKLGVESGFRNPKQLYWAAPALFTLLYLIN